MAEFTLKHTHTIDTKDVVRGGIALVLLGIILGVLVVAYIWFSGGDGNASAPIIAPHLTIQPDDSRVLFRIVPEESEVRFRIEESLLGKPTTVIGSTNQVAGDFLVDFETPANSQVGLIRVNVRTLKTANEFRNRALRGQILETEQAEFEYADFGVTEFIDLPHEINFGDSIDFQIVGNLTVHGVTRSVIFDTHLDVNSNTKLEGTAMTTVLHTDFDIAIPEAPGVANISDELQLEIDFVAEVADNT